MGIFEKKSKQSTAAPAFSAIEPTEPPVNHNTVLDYMLELTDEDYEKLLKCAKIYREANRKVADIMGVDGVATETIAEKDQPAAEDDDAIDQMLDDELAAAFIETDTDKKGNNDSDAKTK